ncbi:MAG: neutral zinc metallopeptidase [Pseudomonadota bacterium]
MRWRGRRRSGNIEDRRGQRTGGRVGRRAGMGGGMTIIALIAALIFGFDPSALLGVLGGGSAPVQQTRAPTSDQDAEVVEFLSVVLADTEQVWGDMFQRAGLQYKTPKLVLYNDATPTACGTGQAAAGPFYCPGDHKLYLDLSFLAELQRMGAEGDFALAYVIAHEVGHHIQTLEGTAARVQRARQRMSQVDGNRVQVAMELQADCYAGVWAHHAHTDRQLLEPGDIEEGMAAAAAVGDDTLQRKAGRRVVPEAFTHGTSAQRTEWLIRGLRSGDVRDCDTFS